MDTGGSEGRASLRRTYTMLFTIIKLALVVYAGLLILMYFAQGRLLFIGGRVMDRTPADPPFGWEYEDLDIPVDGETANAWFIPAPSARGVVIFSHGNAGAIADRLESIQVFRELRFSVLIYDYGGYGKSTGKASEERAYADIRAMWRYLTEDRGIPPERIALFGRSLGGGPTVQLATEVNARAVILESTFLSVAQLAQEMLPIFWVKPFIRHRFDNAAKVPQIKAPKLHIHSADDSLIPYRHGRKLFELAGEPKQFLEIRGDHNEGFVVSWSHYKKGLDEFLTPLFKDLCAEPETG